MIGQESTIERGKATLQPTSKPAPRNVRRVISLVVAGVVVGGLVEQGRGLDWRATARQIGGADLWLVLLAAAIFYAGFLVRCARWRVLLANAGLDRAHVEGMPPFAGLVGIMYRAWFVNAVTVAQAGDAYRAYLLKRRAGAPMPRTIGTVVVERLVDLVVLAALLIPAVALAFGRHLPGTARWALAAAVLVALAGPVALRALPRIASLACRFLPRPAAGAVGRFGEAMVASPRRISLLVALSAGGWLGETMMLALVARAAGVPLPPAQAATVALTTALMTALPVTPGGLGVAEAGMILLLGQFGLAAAPAAAIALLARAISFGSVVAGGGILSLVCVWLERRGGSSPARGEIATPRLIDGRRANG